MIRSPLTTAVALLAAAAPLVAQSAPSTVFIEAMTWEEIRDQIAAGKTTILIPTAGTEQKGPHMAIGQHKFVMEHTTDQIARALGNALVSPIITYVPEGAYGEEPTGHMRMAGTVSLPEEWFRDLLRHTAKSHAAGGFTDIVFLGDSGGNQRGMSAVTDELNAEWAGSGTRAHFIGDYYAKSSDDIRSGLRAEGYVDEQIGSHGGIVGTSQLLFANPVHVRPDAIAPRGGFEGSGVSGDPTLATAELGQRFVRIKIDNAVSQIRQSVDPAPAPIPAIPVSGRALRARPAGDPYLEEMTWTEIRDAIAGGKRTAIIPTGGTEQNGPHMVMGKHNYIITYAAGLLADELGDALIAPTIAWVPEGSYDRPSFGDKPGVITNPSPSYDNLLEATARSLRTHGFEQILFIGDSGGNQNGMQAVAERLADEWADDGVKVFALLDFYRKGQEYGRAWLQAEYGYERSTIGSHAGITDTSAVMFVYPDGVRSDRRMPGGGSPDAGVTGDPTLASPEIGRVIVQLKVVAALQQYRELTAPPRGAGRRGGPSGH